MIRKYLIPVMAFLLISGCQVSQTQQTPIQSPSQPQLVKSPPKPVKKKVVQFVYNPAGKEQFVLYENTSSQKHGFDSFCTNTESYVCFNDWLPYDKYVGMKGYFDSESSTKKHYSGYEFYPVVLENGLKIYFVSNKKYGGKYGSSSPIIPLKLYNEIKYFNRKPLIPGSSIQLVSADISFGDKYYQLSNGKEVPDSRLKLIRELCSKFGNNPEMAELLLDMSITKDEIDYRFFISPGVKGSRSEAELYIGVDENDEWLRFRVKFYGDDWLFVSSYKVAADDFRWQSPKLSFERDHSSGSVWEWIDLLASAEHIKIAKALANAEKSTIRFQGDQYYSDEQLQDDQKEGINQILKLFRLMKNA